jgi:hypothetical protein
MDLLKLLLDNNESAGQLAQLAGVDAKSAGNVLEQLLPALTQGLQNNLQQGGGVEALASALQSGNHQRYLDNPASLGTPEARADGNGILGHLLGSKDVSRQLASQVSGATGVDSAAIKQMLPMVAALAMGALSKQTGGGAQLQGGAGDILSALLSGDGDGQGGLGAVMGLAKKFL